MYVGTNYNSYYASRWGDSNYSNASSKVRPGYVSPFASGSLQASSSVSSLFGSSGLTQANTVKTNATSFKAALNELSNKAFTTKVPTSSNNDAVTVKAASKYSYNNGKETSIEVDQLAANQVNRGTQMAATARVGSEGAGSKAFEIEAGGKTYQFNIDVKATDSNRDVQRKMADAINARKIGVTASVDFENSTSQLRIQGGKTGVDNEFSVRDVTGDLVSRTGAGNVSQQAQDAMYRVDGGVTRSSSTNEDVSIGNGLTATFKKVTSDPITVSMQTDSTAATKAVNEFVKSYNALYNAVKDSAMSGDQRSSRLFDQMLATNTTYSSQLTDAGITFNGDGEMVVNETLLKDALQDGSLENLFKTTGNYGFTGRLQQIATSAQSVPSSFSSSAASGSNNNSFVNGSFFYSNSRLLANSNFVGIGFDAFL